jgi:hypothetical protein
MGLFRKAMSVSTLGTVNYNSKKDTVKKANKANARLARAQAKLAEEEAKAAKQARKRG